MFKFLSFASIWDRWSRDFCMLSSFFVIGAYLSYEVEAASAWDMYLPDLPMPERISTPCYAYSCSMPRRICSLS